MSTPTNHPKSVLMEPKNTKLNEFIMNIYDMSQFRFFIFILSILCCFFVVIAAVLIPCEWSTCISSTKIKDLKPLWSGSIFTDKGFYHIIF